MSTISTNQEEPSALGASKPRLWIKRLAIFESPQSVATPIRDISFHRGLNIVWGVELPENAGADSAHPITLSGHSVGKTTLCRLIRYCLGESAFGNQGAVSRIKHAFPEGWVGMQLEVEGQDWAVLKPIGQAGYSKAAPDAAIEDLVDLAHKENRFGNYMDHLRTSMLSGLKADTPPNSDRPFEWKHLLAWLTRDQEARFQSIHEWRRSRSGSDSLQFKNTKEDPLYLIRLVLEIVDDQELQTANALEERKRQLERVKKQISELKQEPEYRLHEQERILRDLLGDSRRQLVSEELPDEGLFSLETQVDQRREDLRAQVARLGAEIADVLEAEIQLRTRIQGEEDALRRICAEVETLLQSTERPAQKEHAKRLEELERRRDDKCRFGWINYSKCDHFQRQLMEMREKITRLSEEQQQKFIKSGFHDRLLFIQALESEQYTQTQEMENWRKELAEHRERREELEDERNALQVGLQRLNYHAEQRRLVLDLFEGRTPNTELENVVRQASDLSQSVQRLEEQLQQVQTTYGEQLAAIRSVYDGLTKKTLSDSYSGTLRMAHGELHFGIKESSGLAGEAVETLALVLTDVAAMLCSSQGLGHHPRFLVHDSPREADLDRHIYNHFLRAMWALTDRYGGQDKAPFQYIVTTTSCPSEGLDAAICLRLKGRPESKMLLGRRLASLSTGEQATLVFR